MPSYVEEMALTRTCKELTNPHLKQVMVIVGLQQIVSL